jgi:drug/metabolite transporter (DMT)-like permease
MTNASPESKKLQKNTSLGYVLYSLAALLWSINGSVSKLILLDFNDPIRVTQLRTTGAMAVLIVVVLITQRHTFKISRRELPIVMSYGLFGIAATQVFYFFSIARIPVSISLLIEFMAPIFVVLYAKYVQKMEVKATLWLGLGFSLSGLVLVAKVWEGMTFDTLGIVFAIGAMATLVLYYILGEKAGHNRDSISLTMWAFIFTAILWALVAPWQNYPWEQLSGSVNPWDSSTIAVPMWALATYMVIGGTVLPFVLVLSAIKHLGGAGASIMGLVEPLIATIIAWLILGEVLSTIQIIGGVVILVGVYVAERARG